ncbi:MAG: hypothetical protein QHH06_04850 [Clostridiales bacterium]|jgi:hexokinase|nr:hypothetical protein [Eubacteriales bacterium]MDH7565796.1 hypothetical protein [Clostridiales bacterium]
MHTVKEKVYGFLRKYGMDYESIDMEQNCRLFIEEMENGLKGGMSSLPMIPTYISAEKDVPADEPVIAIDAGGTNFRVALVHFDGKRRPVIENFKLYPMPGTEGELTKEKFFETVAQYIQPLLDKSGKIGFCFSYPTEILPHKDGRLIRFSKEVKVKGVEGQLIGANLLRTFKEMGMPADKRIVLLNDTVATLLGGKASYPERVFDGYIGFILGTGTNTCYIEDKGNIRKIPQIAAEKGTMLVNIESGSYGKAPRGQIDREFDTGTANPGRQVFEKAISGAYLGGLILAVIKRAAGEGLLSRGFYERITGVNRFTSEEVDEFLNYPYGGNNLLARCCGPSSSAQESDDRIVLYHLIDAIMERAGKLAAINLSAIILKTGKGKNPCAPACIAAEGSTFRKSKLFRTKLEYYMKVYLRDQKETYCEFVEAENTTMIGTAIAALLN